MRIKGKFYLFLITLFVLALSLSFFQPAWASVEEIFVAPMSHLDIGFTGTQDQVARSYKQKIDSALRQLEHYPEYRWTIETFWQLKSWLKRTEDQGRVEDLLRLIREGRLELAGAYANTHTNFIAGESFIRLLRPAERFAIKHDLEIDTVIQNDVPGYSKDLATVLTESDVEYFVTGINTTLNGGFDVEPSQNPFYWKAPNGDKILTWLANTETYKGYWGGYEMLWGEWMAGKEYPKQVEELLSTLEEENYPYDAILLLRANDNKGPQASNLLKRVEEWNKNHEPRMVISTPSRFMKHMEEKYSGEFPTFSGGWPFWGENKTGSPVTSARTRWLHERLPTAETLLTIKEVAKGANVEEEQFQNLYERVLFSDAHSSAGGPSWPEKLSIRQVEEKNRTVVKKTGAAVRETYSLLEKGVSGLAQGIRGKNPRLFLFNPQANSDGSPVKVEISGDFANKLLTGDWQLIDPSSGSVVSYEVMQKEEESSENPWYQEREASSYVMNVAPEKLPELGYKVLEFKKSDSSVTPSMRERSLGHVLKNYYYRITVDSSGYVSKIKDRVHDRQILADTEKFKFGRLFVGNHQNKYSRSFHGDPADSASEVKITLKDGPVTKRLSIRYESCPLLRAELVLYDGEPWIDFRILVDRSRLDIVPYEEHSKNLYVSFPFAIGREGLVEGPLSFKTEGSFLPGAETGRTFSRGVVQFFEGRSSVTMAHRQSFASTMAAPHGRIKGGAPPRIPSKNSIWIDQLLKKFDETKAMEGIAEFDPEPGVRDRIWFEYRLSSFLNPGDRGEVTEFREQFVDPVLTKVLRSGQKSDKVLAEAHSRSYFSSLGEIEILTLKRGRRSGELVLRLRNPTSRREEVSLKTTLPLSSAQEIAENGEKVAGSRKSFPMVTTFEPAEIKSFILIQKGK